MGIKETWQRDKVTVLILLFALLACLYTMATGYQYQVQCNTHWQVELEKMYESCGCMCGDAYTDYVVFNDTYDLNIFDGGEE